jgi:hypothetical protein
VLSAACNTLLGLPDVPVPIDATAPDSGGGSDATAADVSNETAKAPADDANDATNASEANDAGDANVSCGDTTSSAHNCGVCGHDCLGGTCSMSVCQPVALVTSTQRATPVWLAQDDTFLYWTDDNNDKVYRTDKSSGGALVLTQSTSYPIPLAVDDAGLYWGDVYGIWECPKAGCASGPALIAQTVAGLPRSLAVDPGQVYWTEEGSITVLFAPKDALDASPGVLWQNDASTIMWGDRDASDFYTEHVAADGQRVYFTASDGLLRAVDIDGGDVESAGAVNQMGSFDVALDTSHVYWSVPNPAAGLIDRVTSGDLTDAGSVVSGLSSPTFIATDGTRLYWAAASADGSGAEDIFGCTIASCQPTRLAGGFMAATIVVDSKAIYWTDHGTTTNNGAVWKLAK